MTVKTEAILFKDTVLKVRSF